MGKRRQPAKPEKSGKAPGSAAHHVGGGSSQDAKPPAGLLIAPRADWHASELADIEIPNEVSPVQPHLIDRVHKYAKSLLDAETTQYASTQLRSSSSHQFYSTIMQSGTWGDKVSALTLLVQESPVHTTKYFDNLLGMAGKKTRSQALIALGAIKDMMAQGMLLPKDRSLRFFNRQPALLAVLQDVSPSWTEDNDLPGSLTKAHLVVWAFEDWLKSKYFEMLRILETWGSDEVEFSRTRALQFVAELLREKPEQEENLLRLLVNKLGDNSRKVASKASHLLLQMQTAHPDMKLIIVEGINADILLRSGQSAHAKYYAVITLNQTVLQSSKPDLANKLLEVYFSIFVAVLNKSRHLKPVHGKNSVDKKRKRSKPTAPSPEQSLTEEQLDERIIAQVLTGINRAFPYSKADSGTFEKHLDTMFRICHSSNFNTSIQALVLIQQISTSHHITTDRFMRTLYESLLDPRLLTSSKQTMYLNLLYKALKDDSSIRRVRAFIKRLLQILSLHDPPFIISAIYLVIELMDVFPNLKSLLDTPDLQEDDEEEIFRDVPEDSTTPQKPPTTSSSKFTTSYDPRKRDPLHANATTVPAWELSPYNDHYHPSIALFTSYLFSAQPSPSLSSSTQRTVKGQVAAARKPAKPDPAAHTLMHFLDRFVYRNAKAPSTEVTTRGSSLMQPALASRDTADTLFRVGAGETTGGIGGVSSLFAAQDDIADSNDHINSAVRQDGASGSAAATHWDRLLADIKPEDVFFHQYFTSVGPKKRAALERKAGAAPDSSTAKSKKDRKKAGQQDSGDEQVDDEWDDNLNAGEDEIWKALVGSAPELKGADEESDEESGFGSEDDDDFAKAMESDEDGEDVDSDDEDDDAGVEINMDSDEESVVEGEEMDENDVDLRKDIAKLLGNGISTEEVDDDNPRPDEQDVNMDEEQQFSSEEDDIPVNMDSDEEIDVEKDAKKSKNQLRKKERKAKKALPMFADVGEYSKLLEDDSDGYGENEKQEHIVKRRKKGKQ